MSLIGAPSHPSEKRSASQISLKREGWRSATRLPRRSFGTVTALCRLTAHGIFMPSSSSSKTCEGTSRIIDVTGATVTVARYGIALSRVSTTTGRSISGDAKRKSRISPRAIFPATRPLPPTAPIRLLPGAAWRNPGGLDPRSLVSPFAADARAKHRAPMRNDWPWFCALHDPPQEAISC